MVPVGMEDLLKCGSLLLIGLWDLLPSIPSSGPEGTMIQRVDSWDKLPFLHVWLS